MPTEDELEEMLTKRFLDDRMLMKGVGCNGGSSESVEVMGALVERGSSDSVSGKNFLQD